MIDHLDEHTIVAAGLSGHGYKYSCVLGAIVGELALGLEPSIDLAEFGLERPTLAAATVSGMLDDAFTHHEPGRALGDRRRAGRPRDAEGAPGLAERASAVHRVLAVPPARDDRRRRDL